MFRVTGRAEVFFGEALKVLIPSLSALGAEAVLVSTHPCKARPQVRH